MAGWCAPPLPVLRHTAYRSASFPCRRPDVVARRHCPATSLDRRGGRRRSTAVARPPHHVIGGHLARCDRDHLRRPRCLLCFCAARPAPTRPTATSRPRRSTSADARPSLGSLTSRPRGKMRGQASGVSREKQYLRCIHARVDVPRTCRPSPRRRPDPPDGDGANADCMRAAPNENSNKHASMQAIGAAERAALRKLGASRIRPHGE